MPLKSGYKSSGLTINYSLFLYITWTILIASFATWNIYQTHKETIEKARIEARTIFEHNLAYRRWNTMHGGVYAPVTEKNQPNPYLVVPNRDVNTTDGRQLTMINPFRMTKQAYDLLKEQSPLPTINRTVSLNPLNPDNAADEWEEKAMKSFEKGIQELSEITTIKNKPYLRLIQPYITNEGCLKCHGFQGYKTGDIRGGMSIAVPMKPYYKSEMKTRNIMIITHLLLWLAGMAGIFMFSKNIQKQQDKISESEWKFRTLSEFAHDWEYWITEDMRIVFMSPSCEAITGYKQEDFMNNPNLLLDIIHPEDLDKFKHHLDNFKVSEHDEMEFRIITKNRRSKWLSHVCGPIYVGNKFLGRRVSDRDITDRKKLEEQLFQSQKMESLGLLAGSVAHDFNNLLTAISGYAAILQEDLNTTDERVIKDIQIILSASEKAQVLTSNLLTFSRKQSLKQSTTTLSSVIMNISGLLKHLTGEGIDLKIRYSEKELPVFIDSHKMEQVIMNLASNARDAMSNKGVLSIETSLTLLDNGAAARFNSKPGEYMILAVSDTGAGIDKELLPNIFEPFFTTKSAGHGTGLGLSTVYGIIKQHKGFVDIYSEKGIGTTFKIYIPVSKEQAVEEKIPTEELRADLRGTETILVAEDEETVRELMNNVLSKNGYKVILAADGEKAVEKYNEHKDNISMLILDVVMPGMNGKAVYDLLVKTTPGLKALFISGYTQDILTSKGIYKDGLEFVPKPLNIQVLLSKVRSILDAK